MGCDIHFIVAKYDPATGSVDTLHDPEECYRRENYSNEEAEQAWRLSRVGRRRNYRRFARLSGVRGDGPPPNGWPEWAQEKYSDDLASEDLHSHTHYPIREAARLFLETEYPDDDLGAMAQAAPVSMYFNVDPDRHDLDQIVVLICYDN